MSAPPSGVMNVPGGGSALAPAPVTGGRRHRKSARKVSAKTIRKTLKHLGLKPKGRVVLKAGGETEEKMGGRRRRTARKSGLRKLFGY